VHSTADFASNNMLKASTDVNPSVT
jgi:hypothetical protein